ncbi:MULTISPECIES: TetR family transcriptional regulator [Caproicibacterium]|jgi:AcrR family transcriptional regulator|uniref:TetR family transcriptional regulator n=2 Tax=Caproicibacterium lactatifermentans TaxID=2666138 RepID=A0A859DSN4_9FIRM|nr:TetR family transcriptional regulator [Caproicibacterium lactatifermentans]ARP49792.1 hypothetical protein B6259_02110 [Ruminococcaceae bacterium CPB6]MDD4808250.1 TetR family transcriptional regulator [Oscillospiraceae bacterium]QKN24479.1 TetR family transcriptional regulator [Caproicibacterium lactatifermentans]QKO30508.1 TetR family transcriptional regulator [Caproicibacterium lactatifermentans]
MRCMTKERIVETLRDLMKERPLNKITVQNIMDRANMKRQSFYYHFQDIYDVLDWEINTNLIAPLSGPENADCEIWLYHMMVLIDSNRVFYRKTLVEVGRTLTMQKWLPVFSDKLLTLYPDKLQRVEELSDNDRFALEFFARAAINNLMDSLIDRKTFDYKTGRERIHILCSILQGRRMFEQNPIVCFPYCTTTA